MELKVYLQILLKKWWILVSVFLITITVGVVLNFTATPLYTAKATYLVVPNSNLATGADVSRLLDLIGRRDEIASTFSRIAASRKVRDIALQELTIGSASKYKISSDLIAGTNVIQFSVEGPDPVIARDLTNAIAEASEKYVQNLYEIFTLLALDEATIPRTPSSPNTTMNLVLSALFGIILGSGLAFLAEYLGKPIDTEMIASINIIDNETGVYNKPYFFQRLTSEMARAKRNRYPLSLALMRIDNLDLIKGTNSRKVRTDILHQLGVLTSQYLREEDVVAYIENYTFAFLLPDTTGENAKAIMEYLQTRVAWAPFESSVNNLKFNPKGIVGIVDYDHNGISRNELIERATQALQLAEANDQDKAFLMTNNSNEYAHNPAELPA